MDAETGFLIEGRMYEVPALMTLTTDEAVVMYEACGLVQEDFVKQVDETEDEYDERATKLMRHPGFMKSLMQIAYQRGNPHAKPGTVKLVIGKTNRQEAISHLYDAEEDEPEVPLASTSEPSRSSESGSLENEDSTKDASGTSGNGSTNDSDEPASILEVTGTTRSVTYSTSAPTTSVA